MKHRPSYKTVMSVIIPVVLLGLFLAVGIGATSYSPLTVLRVFLSKLPFIGEAFGGNFTLLEHNMIIRMRLPRVLLGFVVGASLSVCGVAMQALVRNRLADPFLLGVSSGASATASLFMVFGVFAFLGRFALPISAFLGAAATIVIVYTLARVRGRVNIPQLLLLGVAAAMLFDAFTSLIILSAPDAFSVHNIDFWLSGSLAGAQWSYLGLPSAAMIICTGWLMLNHRALNALTLGEETAQALGVSVSLLQKAVLLIASLLAGVAISVSGSIGFVGLMVPHIARMLFGADHRRVLPLSVLLGGLLVVWADVAARLLVAPDEVPVGIFTAFVGAPFFLLMLKNKNASRTII